MPVTVITPDTPGFRYEDLTHEIKNSPGLAQETWARTISSERLDRIERTQVAILERLEILNSRQVVKDYYSTKEVAARVDRSDYQVREWCREGRVKGEKRPVGRGR